MQRRSLPASAERLLRSLLGTADCPARACLWTARGYVLTSPVEEVALSDLTALEERGLVVHRPRTLVYEATAEGREFALEMLRGR